MPGQRTVTAARRLQFCAGHRVYKHESKCANLHGHNYVVMLHAVACPDAINAQSAGGDEQLNHSDGLDALGRVIDFGKLKALFAPWIESNWDHGFILYKEDVEGIAALKQIAGQKLFILDTNPTAENMALYLLHDLAPTLLKGSGVKLTAVELWETENCFVRVDDAR
ncbi:MAG: 6-carboxytetrahydropterin synthase [Candidatus Obscuribacter sp.]|nr:6-carboxytetrahydropterin synthase [Candidatus Obscuribacter sp.]